MRKGMRKALSITLAVALGVTTAFNANFGFAEKQAAAISSSATTKDIVTPDNPSVFRDLTDIEIIQEMGTGLNLGNTLEGHTGLTPSELLWQPVEITKEFIKAEHDAGFNTLRVPVTWGTMIQSDYSVKERWMSRVQDIVDYAISEDMYVILNIHHDGADAVYWLNLFQDDEAELTKIFEKFTGLWATIAERFKNYDEHLIFESMNEMHSKDCYTYATDAPYLKNIMEANQRFVDTVRATGSNNAKRWLLVPAWNTNIEMVVNEANGFELPKDTAGKIMLSVHDYDPFGITMAGNVNTTADFTKTMVTNYYYRDFQKLYDVFVSKGTPVVVGEYGIVDKGNTEDRTYYCEAVNRLAKQYGLALCYWEDGGVDGISNPNSTTGVGQPFALFDRSRKQPILNEVVYGLIRGYFNDGDYTEIPEENNGTTTPLTSFDVSKENVSLVVDSQETLTVSNLAPAENNNVVLWKTENPAVATVYNGMIRARGVGSTTITAFAQDGSCSKNIAVTVTANTDIASTGAVIKTDMDAVTTQEDSEVFLNTIYEVNGARQEGVSFSYISADESIATVSTMGKVLGIKNGTTKITITASTGLTKELDVIVEEGQALEVINLALYVYYNAEEENYFGTEQSAPLEIDGGGEYTLIFDAETQLSDAAKAAGVTGLKDFGSLYIKDYDVNEGNLKKSVISTGKIRYTSIKVDGNELKIIDDTKFELVKGSGIIDTGNPLNAWDGSVISSNQITTNTSKFTINFNDYPNAKKIEVSFVLSGLQKEDGSSFGEEYVDSYESQGRHDDEPEPTPDVTPGVDGPEPTTEPSSPAEPTGSPSPDTNTTVNKTVNGIKYQVNTVKKTATCLGVQNNNVKTISIPKTVSVNGVKAKVTAIKANAFAGNKKLIKVTIGANVSSIGKKAFFNCKALKNITINSTSLTSAKVGKKAFAGINANAKIKVPKGKKSIYKKLLKAKGVPAKAKIN